MTIYYRADGKAGYGGHARTIFRIEQTGTGGYKIKYLEFHMKTAESTKGEVFVGPKGFVGKRNILFHGVFDTTRP
ncbi:hypothetical protein KJ632_05260 [Patescibacteria group bacterium]|nr:hypothetical protein [Patescibacteria group bacterium]